MYMYITYTYVNIMTTPSQPAKAPAILVAATLRPRGDALREVL